MQIFSVSELTTLLSVIGLPLAFLVIFAESSLIFFLPGDSFVIAAALLATQGIINIWALTIVMFIAAITGNSLGYYLGHRFGKRLFSRENSMLFDKQHIERSRLFYEKYGAITIVLARFVPMIRTIAPILAGVGGMKYRVFFFYNVIGAILWIFGLGLLSYYAGKSIPNFDQYIFPIIIGIVVLSLVPPAFAAVRGRKKH